jgi:hypothetical protein
VLHLSRTTASDDGKERQKEMSDRILSQIAHRKQEYNDLGKDVAAAMLRIEEVPHPSHSTLALFLASLR